MSISENNRLQQEWQRYLDEVVEDAFEDDKPQEFEKLDIRAVFIEGMMAASALIQKDERPTEDVIIDMLNWAEELANDDNEY